MKKPIKKFGIPVCKVCGLTAYGCVFNEDCPTPPKDAKKEHERLNAYFESYYHDIYQSLRRPLDHLVTWQELDRWADDGGMAGYFQGAKER